jgi:hypothetical protein
MAGDYQLEDTIYIPFTTRAFATGVPTTLAGTPVVTGHRDANITQFTTGITLAADFDSIAGLNMITVVATAANGYVAGETYTLYLSAGTVGGVSVVGEVVGHFTLDMSAAAKDLANGTDGLGAIKAEHALIVADTNELQTDDVPSLIATAQADLDTITGAAGAIVDTGAATATAISDAVWDEDATPHQTQGTFGQAIGDPVADTTTIYQSVATDAAGDNVSVDVAAVKAETALIVADTNELQTDDVPALIAAVQSDTDDIQTRLPAALTAGGKMDSDAAHISGVASAADRLEAWSNGWVSGTCIGTPTTTNITTDATEASANHFQYSALVITGGALLGQARPISAYTGGPNGVFTVTPGFSEAPVATDTWIVIPLFNLSVDASGRADIGSVLGTAINPLVSGRVDADIGAKTGNVALSAQEKLDVNTEADTALTDYDPPTRAELTTDIGTVVTDLDDVKGTGFVKDTHSLVNVEGYVDLIDDGTSGLAKIATDAAAILVDTAEIGAAGAGLSAIPWSAAWDAEVQSEVNDALVAFFTSAATLVNLIWDEAQVETTGAPAITGTMREFMQWWAALSRNKMTQTATTSTLRNDADGADLSTSTVSDDGTTFTRGEWST